MILTRNMSFLWRNGEEWHTLSLRTKRENHKNIRLNLHRNSKKSGETTQKSLKILRMGGAKEDEVKRQVKRRRRRDTLKKYPRVLEHRLEEGLSMIVLRPYYFSSGKINNHRLPSTEKSTSLLRTMLSSCILQVFA